MRYRKLGNTGLIVSEMCLGAMTFGTGEGMWATVGSVSQEDATDLVRPAFATKVLLRMGQGHNQIGLSRYHIMEGVDASLKRLQADHIDLYQIHGRDPFTPLEETLDALDDCVRAGKVRYLGLGNLPAGERA